MAITGMSTLKAIHKDINQMLIEIQEQFDTMGKIEGGSAVGGLCEEYMTFYF